MSGPGSSLSATKAVREWLDAIVKDHGIRHILDLGCGDGNWQAEIQSLATPNAADGQVMYLGLDISTTALKKARERHAQKPFMKWAVADMAAEYHWAGRFAATAYCYRDFSEGTNLETVA